MRRLIGAIDLGTTSARFSLFTREGEVVAAHQTQIKQVYPGPGMHTQDPKSYLSSALLCISEACKKGNVSKAEVAGIGITNQRETIIAWDRKSREPLAEAIVWDDARTAADCDALAKKLGGIDALRSKTGLPITPYFSGTKIAWLLRNNSSVRSANDRGQCCFSTVDSWLLSQLTNAPRPVTDVSNASRTMLLGLNGKWDQELCALFGVGVNALPEVRSCSEVYGVLAEGPLAGVPVCGSIGDQQAALLGHGCTQIGQLKNTYGTGSFLLVNTGQQPVRSSSGLLTTIYGQFGPNGPLWYALEGAIEAAGSCVEWAIKQIGLARDIGDFSETVEKTKENGGVYFVPALGGLYTPYWRNDARGLFIGLTHHTTRGHMLRSILEGVSFRTAEAVRAVEQDLHTQVQFLAVDGGMTKNKGFLQMQADIAGKRIEVPPISEVTSIGAAVAAMVGCGEAQTPQEVHFSSIRKSQTVISPQLSASDSEALWRNWREAVSRSLGWVRSADPK